MQKLFIILYMPPLEDASFLLLL